MTACCTSKSLFLPLALLVGAGALALGANSFAAATQDPKPPAEKPQDGAGGEKPREGGRPGGRGQGGGPGLEGSMQAMNAAVKALGKELEAKDANAWRSVSQFQRGVAGAKLDEPKSIKEMPEGERAAALVSYRTMMADLLQATCKLEHEILAGKWEDANKTFADQIRPAKKRGHDKFNPDDK